MKKYLLKMAIDVADENNAHLLTVVDEYTLDRIKNSYVSATLFQCDEEPVLFSDIPWYNRISITEITDEEYEMLKRLDIHVDEGIYFYSSIHDEEEWELLELPDWTLL